MLHLTRRRPKEPDRVEDPTFRPRRPLLGFLLLLPNVAFAATPVKVLGTTRNEISLAAKTEVPSSARLIYA